MELSQLCQALPSAKILVLKDGCYSVQYRDSNLVDFCCIGKNLAYPLDGFEKVFVTIGPNSNHILFDNQLELPSPAYTQKYIARGVILYFFYPEKDETGGTVSDDMKSIGLSLTDTSMSTFTLPVYDTFSILNNPVTTDKTKIINKIEVVNNNNFDVTISGLIILVDREGVNLDATIGCG